MSKRAMAKAVLTLVIGIALAASVGMMMLDQTKTFIAATGDWDVGSNWDPAGEPGAGDFVIIPTGKTCNVDSTTQRPKTLELASVAAINVKSGGNLSLAYESGRTSTIDGTITLEASDSVVDLLNSHTLGGNGKIVGQSDSATLSFASGTTLTSNIVIEGRLKIVSGTTGTTVFINQKTVHANAAGTFWVNCKDIDDSSTALWRVSTSSSAVLRFDPNVGACGGGTPVKSLDGDFTIEAGTLDVDCPGFESTGTLTWTGGVVDCNSNGGGSARCTGT